MAYHNEIIIDKIRSYRRLSYKKAIVVISTYNNIIKISKDDELSELLNNPTKLITDTKKSQVSLYSQREQGMPFLIVQYYALQDKEII